LRSTLPWAPPQKRKAAPDVEGRLGAADTRPVPPYRLHRWPGATGSGGGLARSRLVLDDLQLDPHIGLPPPRLPRTPFNTPLVHLANPQDDGVADGFARTTP